MKKYKVCVYAISKNEEKFVDRWVDSMKEADDIYVLDTGSSDNTVKKLKQRGINVSIKEIKPWRFDVARNESLNIIPDKYDIYVCTDLDEVLVSGWREALESKWTDNTTRAFYNYNWKLDENNNPIVNFYTDKIHIRNNYKWVHPVHEVLEYQGIENYVTIDDIVLNHYPDINKSRSMYLPLLEQSVKENPNDDRNMHYLGREYMYYGKWQECIDTLKKHLELPSSTWRDERCASMRFISRAYQNLNNLDESRNWLKKAIKEAPYLREPWIEMGLLEYYNNNWVDSIYYIEEALKIKEKSKSYINENFSWNELPYDILSICYFNIKNYEQSLSNINKAIELNSKDERLKQNKEIIKEYINT